LLRRMEEKDDDVRPSLISYNTVLSGYAKAGDSEGALRLLHRMNAQDDDSLRPNIDSYNNILAAFCKKGDVRRARQMLEGMKQGNLDTGVPRPDHISYTTVLYAHHGHNNSSSSLHESFSLLNDMIADPHVPSPDTVAFNVFLHTIARSSEHGKARLARDVWNEVKISTKEGPDVITVNSVLNACNFPVCDQDKPEALGIAEELMAEVLKATNTKLVNETTFHNMIKTYTFVSTAPREEKMRLIRTVLQNASKLGMVGEEVLQALNKAVQGDERLWRILNLPLRFDNKILRLDDLPPDWKRNCRRRNRRQGQNRGKK